MRASTAVLDRPEPTVAKKPAPEEPEPRGRIDLRADPEWIARVQRQADRFGLKLSAYIRHATSERVERDEATDPRDDDE